MVWFHLVWLPSQSNRLYSLTDSNKLADKQGMKACLNVYLCMRSRSFW